MDQRDKRIDEFVELFNSKRFFEAHEVLEDLWIETESDVKDYYKGLIQCAVAFVHLERGNYRGAKKLFRTACGYLNRYPSPLEGIDVEKLLKDFHEFFESHVFTAAEDSGTPDFESLNTPKI